MSLRDDFPSNSNKNREERRTTPKLDVNVKKKEIGLGGFFQETFVDTMKYAYREIFKPAVRDIIYDVVTGALDFSLKGDNRSWSSKKPERKWASGGVNISKKSESEKLAGLQDWKSLRFESAKDAEALLNALHSNLMEYGSVSVSELYEALDIECEWTLSKYGWKTLDGAAIRHYADGYGVYLPNPLYLK